MFQPQFLAIFRELMVLSICADYMIKTSLIEKNRDLSCKQENNHKLPEDGQELRLTHVLLFNVVMSHGASQGNF